MDAVQESAFKPWRKLGNLREGSTLRPWFLTFADVHDGWLAIASKLFKTTDGGHTWTSIQAVQS